MKSLLMVLGIMVIVGCSTVPVGYDTQPVADVAPVEKLAPQWGGMFDPVVKPGGEVAVLIYADKIEDVTVYSSSGHAYRTINADMTNGLKRISFTLNKQSGDMWVKVRIAADGATGTAVVLVK